MHYFINGYCVCRCITVVKGVSLPMCLFLGRMASGLILITVHWRLVGSLALNILSRGTMKRFWSEVN